MGIRDIIYFIFFFQAEDGIRDAQESRGLGDVYKRQDIYYTPTSHIQVFEHQGQVYFLVTLYCGNRNGMESLLYMAGPEGVQQVEGFYYGAWAAGTGLYTILSLIHI